jgi:hypothetical protein
MSIKAGAAFHAIFDGKNAHFFDGTGLRGRTADGEKMT